MKLLFEVELGIVDKIDKEKVYNLITQLMNKNRESHDYVKSFCRNFICMNPEIYKIKSDVLEIFSSEKYFNLLDCQYFKNKCDEFEKIAHRRKRRIKEENSTDNGDDLPCDFESKRNKTIYDYFPKQSNKRDFKNVKQIINSGKVNNTSEYITPQLLSILNNVRDEDSIQMNTLVRNDQDEESRNDRDEPIDAMSFRQSHMNTKLVNDKEQTNSELFPTSPKIRQDQTYLKNIINSYNKSTNFSNISVFMPINTINNIKFPITNTETNSNMTDATNFNSNLRHNSYNPPPRGINSRLSNFQLMPMTKKEKSSIRKKLNKDKIIEKFFDRIQQREKQRPLHFDINKEIERKNNSNKTLINNPTNDLKTFVNKKFYAYEKIINSPTPKQSDIPLRYSKRKEDINTNNEIITNSSNSNSNSSKFEGRFEALRKHRKTRLRLSNESVSNIQPSQNYEDKTNKDTT